MLTEEERTIIVKCEYEKALTLYFQAEKNAELKFWDAVANRLYYSAFHAVSALLIKDQLKAGTHKGAVLLFGQNYVRTGIFSNEEGRFYSQLQTIREKADYNCIWEASEDEVLPLMQKSKLFLEKIKSHLTPYINT